MTDRLVNESSQYFRSDCLYAWDRERCARGGLDGAPILNPNGLALGVRTNRDGIDLNRDYRDSRSLEIKGHIESLLTLGRFDASMLLHEDYEGIGAYLYELNDTLDAGLGSRQRSYRGSGDADERAQR